MTVHARLTTKGQITIPKEIREALHLGKGDQVAFRLREDGVVELLSENIDFLSLCGMLEPEVRGVTLEQMEETILARGAGLEAAVS